MGWAIPLDLRLSRRFVLFEVDLVARDVREYLAHRQESTSEKKM